MKKYFALMITAAALLSGCASGQPTDGTEAAELVRGETEITSETEVELKAVDWTFDDFVSDVEINGIKLSLPCSYDELSKCFELQKPKYATDYYNEEIGKYCYSYELRNKECLLIYAEYHSENSENALKAEDMYNFFVASDLTGDNACLFRFGEINNYSNMTKNDVEKILGKPNEDTSYDSWYWFDNSNYIVIDYGGKNSVSYINCFWK